MPLYKELYSMISPDSVSENITIINVIDTVKSREKIVNFLHKPLTIDRNKLIILSID
jgi:hypothetical protein